MLWSLLKVVLFIGAVMGLAFGAGVLLESDGGLQISVASTEFTLGPLESVIAAVIILALMWILLKLISLLVAIFRFFSGDETAFSRWWGRNQERRGLEAFADSMMALASGEGRLALKKAERAESYLRRPGLTNLLIAQASEMAGDRTKAEETYKKLLADDRTRFVGVRGIMKQKLADGETDLALKLAEKAFALKPRHEDTQDVLLQLQAEGGDWTGARRTLGAKLKHGSLPRDVHRRRDAVLALSSAKDLIDENASIETREAAIEANKLSPDLIPAAILAADQYIADGKKRLAARVIKKAWTALQHPELAAAFARIEPDETPTARIKRFSALTKIKPSDPETRMLLAELNIAAEDFAAARTALGDLAEADPTTRSLTLMAAIERGSGAEDAVVKGFLARALTAPRGPQWVCENCGAVYEEWVPICEACGAFDTLVWKRPTGNAGSIRSGVDMLPLIVGEPAQIEDATAEDAELIEETGTETDGGPSAEEALDEAVVEATADTVEGTAEPANTPDEPVKSEEKASGAAAS